MPRELLTRTGVDCRPYTPITAPNVEGKLELMVKHYPNGVMTEHIFSLKEGDQLSMKGPIVKYPLKDNEFAVSHSLNRQRHPPPCLADHLPSCSSRTSPSSLEDPASPPCGRSCSTSPPTRTTRPTSTSSLATSPRTSKPPPARPSIPQSLTTHLHPPILTLPPALPAASSSARSSTRSPRATRASRSTTSSTSRPPTGPA